MRASSADAPGLLGQRARMGMKALLWAGAVLLVGLLVFWGLRLRAGWASSALLDAAEEKWRKADYLGAVHDYDRLVDRYPKSADVPEAYYWKGLTSVLYLDDPKGAIEAFQKAIARDPPSAEVNFGLKARRALAEVYERQLDRPTEAIGVYEALIEVTPDREEAQRTRYKIGELYESMGDLAQARVEWDLLVKTYPESPWAPPALYRKGGTYFVTGNCVAALKVYTRVYTRYPESETSSFAKFRAANCLEMGKQKEAAYALYKELKDGAYPDQADIARKIEALRPATVN